MVPARPDLLCTPEGRRYPPTLFVHMAEREPGWADQIAEALQHCRQEDGGTSTAQGGRGRARLCVEELIDLHATALSLTAAKRSLAPHLPLQARGHPCGRGGGAAPPRHPSLLATLAASQRCCSRGGGGCPRQRGPVGSGMSASEPECWRRAAVLLTHAHSVVPVRPSALPSQGKPPSAHTFCRITLRPAGRPSPGRPAQQCRGLARSAAAGAGPQA